MGEVMKKTLFIALLFVSWFSLAEDQEDTSQVFKQLNPAEQLETILRETKYLGTDYIRHRTIFLENPEAKSLLFTRFNSIEIRWNGSPVNITYSILDNMLYTMIYLNNKLDRNEELLLADIYEKHLDYYLKKYKKIDALLIRFETIIHIIRDNKNIKDTPGYGLRTYEKYKSMGYEDLKYEYEEYGPPQTGG
jgi:hypothetical protein